MYAHSRAQHHDMTAREVNVVLNSVVREVEVVCLRGVLGCDRVDLLHPRAEVERLAQRPNLHSVGVDV
jgi:hypothetical protein